MKTKTGMYWHCHHDKLCEYVYDYDERVEYIKNNKPKHEIEIRLKLFQKIKGKLPRELEDKEIRQKCEEARQKYEKAGQKCKEAWQKCKEARQKYEEAWQKYEEARQKYEEAWQKYEEAWQKCKEAWQKYEEAWQKYEEARQKYEEAWQKCVTKLEKLHAKECGCKEWNGKELIFTEEK